MQIYVNGEARQVPEGTDMAGLVELLELGGRRIAVEVNEELEKATAEHTAAETAAKGAETAAAADASEKRRLANEAKAKRDKLVADQTAASSKLAEANRKADAARVALRPRRDQAFQDLLWALFNTKEFLFNH